MDLQACTEAIRTKVGADGGLGAAMHMRLQRVI